MAQVNESRLNTVDKSILDEVVAIDPAFQYAYQKLGYLVFIDNEHTFSKAELDRYFNTLAEYRDTFE